MLLSFGAVLMDIRTELESNPPSPNIHYANQYSMGVGGKAALQALAAAKSGARAALVSQIGDDHYGKNILLRLRQHGVITSGVARQEKTPTGSAIHIGKSKQQLITALGASANTSHEQVPIEILEQNALLLLQDQLPAAKNLPLIKKAKQARAPIIMNFGSRNDIDLYNLEDFKFIICPEHAEELITHINSKKHEGLIIIRDKGAYTYNGIQHETPNIPDMNWVDTTCTEDAFCGSFAASILAELPIEKALQRATVTATLTASKKGAYNSIPYPDEIKDALKNMF